MGFRNALLTIAVFSILVASILAARIVDADGPWGVVYGHASRADEVAFLDNLAIFLERHPEMVGHLVYFSSEKLSASRMKTRANRAVRYLTNKRKVDSKRLIVLYGGHNEHSKIVLQPLPYKLQPSPYNEPEKVPLPNRNPSHKQ